MRCQRTQGKITNVQHKVKSILTNGNIFELTTPFLAALPHLLGPVYTPTYGADQ